MSLSRSVSLVEPVSGFGLRDVRVGGVVLRVVAVALALVGLGLGLGLGVSSAWADGCANATLRAQNGSAGLPDCRAYEMVTPPYKEGFPVRTPAVSDDGAVAFTSLGVFGDSPVGSASGVLQNQYVAMRSAAGWTTVAKAPPYATWDTLILKSVEALSADFATSLWATRRRGVEDQLSLYLRGPDGSMTRVGPGAVPGNPRNPYVQGTSKDLSHIVFAHGIGIGSARDAALWELVGTGNVGPGRAVSVDNDGQPLQPETCLNRVSDDGRVIAFTSGCNGIGTPQVWARVGGSASVAVSGSECTRTAGDPDGACQGVGVAPSDYVGSAVDGSRVLFTTTQQLVDGDIDTDSDLYACDIPGGVPVAVGVANRCSVLREVSGVVSSARVQSFAGMSDDGSRVYFVAKGVLADNVGTDDGAAVDGQDNLYLWSTDAAHPAGRIRFVSGLPGGSVVNPQVTPDGRYVVFGTRSRLVRVGPGADTDCVADAGGVVHCAVDVYRYDAERETMVRVSTGVSGSGGNAPGLDAGSPGVTSDGSTVVFTTDEALSGDDVDGVSDVYAWHDDGQVALISDGRVGADTPMITPSGRDIFFFTAARLTTLDGDAVSDVYDARVGGGFDLTGPVPCTGDACQGRPAPAPGLPGPSGSGSGDRGVEGVVPGFSLGAVSVAQRRRLAQTGRVTLVVKTNTPGVVGVSATVAGLSGVVGSARKTVVVPGTVRVVLSLSGKARGRLVARGRLSVRLVVRHSKVAISRSATLKLTHTKIKKAKKARRGSSAGRADGAGGGVRS
jgi:Tol biopolymer transport system component